MATANFTSKLERVLIPAAERKRDAASMAITGLSQSDRDPEILTTATASGGIARRAASCRCRCGTKNTVPISRRPQ